MDKILAENRRAKFDYEILDTLVAGAELLGFEVKSAKAGRMSLVGSYAIIRGGEAWLVNAQIPPYQQNNTPPDYEPTRPRRLLLRREEISELAGKTKDKGIVLVPLSAFLHKNFIKIKLGICRSKKKHDKREALKKKDMARARQRGAEE